MWYRTAQGFSACFRQQLASKHRNVDSEARPCRFGCQYCPHKLEADDVKNRIIAFVDERLRDQLDGHEFKVFVAHTDYVFRWGGRGTHQNCSAPEAVKAFIRLLEVLAMVARAHEAQPQPQLEA